MGRDRRGGAGAEGGRIHREQLTLERLLREGQGVTRPLDAVPEMDRYLYDLQGVSPPPASSPH